MKYLASRRRFAALLAFAFVGVITFLTAVVARPMSPSPPPPGTRYVRAGATTGLNNGTSWTNAYLTLEQALSAAVAGDMIWVAEGTYSPPNTLNPITGTRTYYVNKSLRIYGAFKGNELSLSSRWGLAENTILEGNIPASGGNVADHLFTIDTVAGAPGVLIDGFTIQHGNATAGGGGKGGGIYSLRSDLDITGCILRENIAYFGGGLHFDGVPDGFKTLHILATKFVDNSVETDGGGMYAQGVTGDVVNTQFDTNGANHHGGGVFVWKMPEGAQLDFTNCTLWWNTARNTAPGGGSLGGGVHLGEAGSGSADIARAKFVNCTFARNLEKSCLAGQAIYVSPSSLGELYNSILYWNYGATCSSGTPPIGGSPTVDWCDVETGWLPVGHNVNPPVDPLFIGGSPPLTGGDQLRLHAATPSRSGSKCIDRGSWSWLPNDVHDLDQDGVTGGEKIPIDLLEGGRMIDRHGPGEDPNLGSPIPNDYLDLGAFEKP